VQTILKIIKNTHIHPANQALHSLGAPFYIVGFAMTCGYIAGLHTSLVASLTMLFGAITMFVIGHKIEGNLRSMTPVLLYKFLISTLSRRKVTPYPITK
jgi:hypothetical protein